MASIDSLNIEIKASANDATQAIKNLTNSLKALNAQLGLKDGTKLTTLLKTLAGSAESFSQKVNNISGSGFEKATKGAETASKAMSNATEQAEKYRDALSKISSEQKAFVDRKLFEGMFGKSQNLTDYVPEKKEEPVLALPMFEKMLPAVVQAQSATDRLYTSIEDVVNEAPKIDTVTQSFTEWKAQAQEAEKVMESKNFAPAGYFYENEPGRETSLAVIETYQKVQDYARQCYETIRNEANAAGQGVVELTTNTEQGFQKIISPIEQATKDAREFKKVISDMESGNVAFDKAKFDEAVKGYAQATEAIKNYKKELLGIEDKQPTASVNKDALSNIVQLGNALESLSKHLDEAGNKMIGVFKTLTTPLRLAASEYTEKFKNMVGRVVNFQKQFKASMAKVAAFWKRTMRTFTFMIVRKAFTAIIKEIGTAVQSLALYSNMMGTAFNTDISNMVADFQYLGRSIVSVFAPLLNYIAPIIDAIVDKIATLLSYIGMLIAALGGSSSFTKAKKNVSNYAKSLDQASKSAKNLTMGIDELNILNDSSSGSSNPYDGWEDAWEEVEIPKWILDLGDKLKKMWDDFLAPLKEAWNRAKQYLIDGFKTMVNSLKKLFGDIGRDFLEVWNQEKTIHMFEQILRIIGDIFRVVRNLANAFDEAWNYNRTGFKILENIRDIMLIIVEHARNISYYMIGWAKEIDFKPLLTSFENLTDKAKKLADFLGGVVEDIFVLGILKYIKYLIEDAIPHLQNTIAEIIDAFNFATLRTKLQPLISAVEEMLENIHTGVTNAIGNLGKSLASFVNSGEFYKFLENLANITKVITAERVEKVLTGLGEGIINIAKAVVKFVNSDTFQKFLKAIGEWIDKKSTKEIAGVLEKIAIAIAGFKFAAFTTSKLGGVFKFFAMLTALKNLKTIASGLGGVATETTAIAKSTSLLVSPATALSGLANTATGIVSSLGSGLTGLATGFLNLHNVISPVVGLLGSVVTAFMEFKGVAESASNIALALNGSGDASIGGSILGLVGKIGIASAAFTAFLGFPAGLVAGLAVGAAGAIKGIQDAIDQINFDQVTGAILAQGDTTVSQVRAWYDETTSIVAEHIQQWKDQERNLTENRTDIQEYSKALEGLESAFSSNLQATSGMAASLTGIYNDMSASINNYIDESTTALVNNLLAQRDYLESQGYNVDDMIARLLIGADNEKQIVNDATKSMEDASKAYQDAVDKYGEGSSEASAAYDVLIGKIGEYNEAVDKYIEKTDEIDTSEAVEQIQALGKSLDLSQYGSWDEAAAAIKTALNEITTTYDTELTGLNETVESKMEEVYKQFQEGRLSEEDYRLQVSAITEQWTEDTNTLVGATEETFSLFNQSLVTGLQGVAQTAETEWESTNPFKRFFTMGTDKDAYIYSQMQTYVNDMLGESGLTGEMQKALSILPGNVEPYSLEAMTRLVNDSANAYLQGTYDNEDYTSQGAAGSWQNVVNSALNMLDLQPIKDMGVETVNSYDNGIEETTNVSKTTVQTWMNSIPEWIHDSDMHFGSPSKTMIDFGRDTVLGYNQGIDENASSTKSSIAGWFTKVQAAVSEQLYQLFQFVATIIANNINTLGNNLLGNILPTFMQTYILPFFNVEMWQPLFDNLLNMVFIPFFEQFRVWFIEEAMTPWWEEDLLSWFADDKWNEDIFDPLQANIQEHWDTFSGWWDTTMSEWWENQVKPWFKQETWEEQFNNILEAAKKVFDLIKEAIKERIDEAKEAVVSACEEMMTAIKEVCAAIDEMMEKMSGFEGFEGDVTFSFGGKQFASGGFPAYGSLFVAGEPGAGAEWVGNIGGRTGVVSNDEITGIADAVYATGSTESELLGQLLTVARAMLDKDPVVLGDKDIARMANSGQSKLGMSIIS